MAFAANKKPETKDLHQYDASDPAFKSYLGKSVKIDGEIKSDEDLTIEGNVKGDIYVSKSLTIGKDGYINGKISGAIVRISGEAEGQITASEKLEISSDGKYTGDIKANQIKVSEGAKLKATINDDDSKDQKAKSHNNSNSNKSQSLKPHNTIDDHEVVDAHIIDDHS